MRPIAVSAARAPASPSPLVPAVVYGDLIFASGQLGRDPVSGAMVDGGFEEQARRTMENLAIVLEEAGSSFDRVLKTTCFLTDMGDLGAFNAIYASYFGNWKPARSTVAVASLAGTALVEVEAVAVRLASGNSP
jgi:2-iminobutanoate/2-iminopropanoate deaminase